MTCKSCGSDNRRTLAAEIAIHLPGFRNLDKPAVLVFPELLLCLDCGVAKFVVPSTELRVFTKDTAVATHAIRSPER